MSNEQSLNAYIGEFCITEMSGHGLSDFPLYRLLAAPSTEEAARMLCIPHSWFIKYFRPVEVPELEAMALANPLTIFEGQGAAPNRFRDTLNVWKPTPLRPTLLCALGVHRWKEVPRSHVIGSNEINGNHPMRVCRCGRVDIKSAHSWETVC